MMRMGVRSVTVYHCRLPNQLLRWSEPSTSLGPTPSVAGTEVCGPAEKLSFVTENGLDIVRSPRASFERDPTLPTRQ